MVWTTATISALVLSATHCTNLLSNPGFEQGGHWKVAAPVWSIDYGVSRTGSASLRYQNDSPDRYLLATQDVPAQPGFRYRLRAWIRTENIVGPPGEGATVALEWLGDGGAFLGGFYPSGIVGTSDWEEVEGISAVCPAAAKTVRFVCYARPGVTGTAWFDDLELHAVGRHRWHVTVLEPWFRNRLDGCSKLRVRVRLPQYQLTGSTLTARLKRGEEVVASKTQRVGSDTVDMEVPLPALSAGTYEIVVELRSEHGMVLEAFRQTATVGSTPPSKVFFDAHRTRVEGRPFFLLGVYDSEGWHPERTPKRLSEIAAAGFNTVLPYGLLSSDLRACKNYLDTAASLGLKVIVSLKDLYSHVRYPLRRFGSWEGSEAIARGVVHALRDHRAVLAWYVNDESPPEHRTELRALYESVLQEDPDRPCYAVTNQPESAYEFADTADVLGVDPYPVPGAPLTLVKDWVDAAVATNRPVWSVVQAFDKSNYIPGAKWRAPELEELRCMAFTALASGASGLIFYSYHDVQRQADKEQRWREITLVNNELAKFALVVSEGDLVSVPILGGVSRAWKLRDKTHVLLVNPHSREEEVKLRTSSGGKELFSGSTVRPSSGIVKRRLKPLAVEWVVLESPSP